MDIHPGITATIPDSSAARMEVERLLQNSSDSRRMLLSACFCIKGSMLTELPSEYSTEANSRYFRLLPETSEVLIDGRGSLPLLGVVGSLSSWAQRRARELGLKVSMRGFRLILESADLNVLATSPAERDHWLLAIRTLPFGVPYYGKVVLFRKARV